MEWGVHQEYLERVFKILKKLPNILRIKLNFKTNAYFINKAIEEKRPNIIIVDVRAAKDFAKGHIPGAINLPLEKFDSFDGSETEFPGLLKDGFNYISCYTLTCNLAQKAAKNLHLLDIL